MSDPTTTQQATEPPGGTIDNNQLDFLAIYDRYAPTLLGVILKIISDEANANSLLETTFKKVRSELGQFRPEKRPMFVWLLNIARCTALEALNEHQQSRKPTFQLTATGNVKALSTSTTSEPANFVVTSADSQSGNLLDLILFKNCTPEEAALSVGLPVEIVRRQLRLAMQQLRTSAR
jgi:RNA polymerase sigma-70 factor (ECF subfamily)